MIDMQQFYTALQYYTMSAWMRGFASGLHEDHDEALKRELLKAADLMELVWQEYEKQREES
jgi:hypothetical protein